MSGQRETDNNAQAQGEAQVKAQSPSTAELIRFMWDVMRAHRRWLWWVALATPLSVLAETSLPLFIQQTIDGPISQGDAEGVWRAVSLLALVMLTRYVANSAGVYALQLMSLRSLAALRERLFRHVIAQGQRFFDQRTSGALMTRTMSDVDAISESLSQGVVRLISDALLMVGTLAVMLWMNWRLTLVAFSVAPFLVWVVNLCRRQLKALHGGIRASLSALNGLFAELIKGAAELRRGQVETYAEERFRVHAHEFMTLYHKANWWDAGLYAIMDGLASLSVGLVIAFVAYQAGVMQGEGASEVVSVGLIVAFIDALNRVYVPIREFSGRLATIQRSVVAIERVMGLLNTHEELHEGDEAPPLEQMSGEVSFHDVSFRYSPDAPQVLKGVSFHVKSGEVVALVGSTGSGKSTIAKLILRAYEGYTGEVKVGGAKLCALTHERARSLVVAVHQDPLLFKGTIAENIHLWDEGLMSAPERVEEAARRARLHDLVRQLPEGYESSCAVGGANLSVGQRQLITIARAFARPSPIVVLDEATASVDALTERYIDEATAELFAERTVIVIAHRLSTIVKADRVLMLSQGELVASGTHDELLRSSEAYRALIQQAHEEAQVS